MTKEREKEKHWVSGGLAMFSKVNFGKLLVQNLLHAG